jgi:thiol:disulfide interchange protein DsbC
MEEMYMSTARKSGSGRPAPWFAITILTAALLPVLASGEGVPEKYQYVQDEFPSTKLTSVQPSPVEGFLEVAVGAEFYYVSEDVKHIFRGDIYEIDTFENLTEASRIGAQSRYISTIDPETTILFAAEDSKFTVTVFTDIDCGYCRKLHREMDEYNNRGISIRYMFFPRSGPDTPSWFKAEEVWCAESRQEALTLAKSNITVNSEDCGLTPVAAHYEVVSALNLRGTPAIFTEHGQHIMGYRSPDELLQILEDEG